MAPSSRAVEFLGFSLGEMLPEDGGLVAVLKGYFDASRALDGSFCVAGLVFAPGQVAPFVEEWREMLGGREVFHMVDVTHQAGEFKGLAIPDTDAMIRAAVSTITKRARFAVVVSCNLGEIIPALPSNNKDFGTPYPLCCWYCLATVGTWLDSEGRSDKVCYLFENGDGNQGDADMLMWKVRRSRELSKAYHYHSHGFAGKKERRAVALQAADLLAWEYTKFRRESYERNHAKNPDPKLEIRTPRLSFQSIFLNKRLKHKVLHLTPEKVWKYLVLCGLERPDQSSIPR